MGPDPNGRKALHHLGLADPDDPPSARADESARRLLQGTAHNPTMDLREYAVTETSAFVDRLTAVAEATTQKAVEEVRAAADAELERVRAEAEGLKQDSDALRQQVDLLLAESAGLRTQLEAESLRANEATDRLDAKAVAASQMHEAHEAQLQHLGTELEAAQSAAKHAAERTNVLQSSINDAEATIASLRRQIEEARTHAESLQGEITAARTEKRASADGDVATLLSGAIDAFDALGTSSTVADLLATLGEQLAAQYSRIAIFRRKGSSFEGEHAIGLDRSVDVTSIVVPMGDDSIIARAARQGVLEHAGAEQLTRSRPPLGGAPKSAVAAPLVFQGEALGVVYAESHEERTGDAHAAFAGVLVAHANVLLSRLTEELKTARELREYAQMLLHEAEQMFIADTNEGRTEPDRLRRLRDTIDFGRQLYAQRVALEGANVAGLLEEEIAALIDSDPVTDFTLALCTALAEAPVSVNVR